MEALRSGLSAYRYTENVTVEFLASKEHVKNSIY